MKPTLVLMTKGGNKIGALPASSIVFRTSMREYSEFSFDIYKEKCADLEVWNKLVDFKLLWAVEWNKLYELKINLKESTETVKSIEARSLGESELSQINLYNIEINTEADISRDDYKPTILYCAKNDDNFSKYDSLLTRITEKVPHYEIKAVDKSIANIQRTFTFDGKSIYDAFQEIAEEIQCLFIIDCYLDLETGAIKREIKVHDLLSYCSDCQERGDFINTCSKCGKTNITPGYGDDTSIFISTENLADEINYTENSDSVKNCFKLEAGDDLMTATIINCNPNGSSYIWHFSDDMKSDMSDELQNKLNEYDTKYNSYQSADIELPTSAYNSLVNKYNKYVTTDYGEKHEIIASPVKGYPALMQAEYNVIDFGLYLKNGFMPSPTMNNETANDQISTINSKFSGSNPYKVAVKSLSSVTKSTAESYILQIVKTIISKLFKVEISSSSLSSNKWTGAFKLTNSYNEDDTATSSSITINLTDDNSEYVRQRIEQVLDKKVSRDDSAMGAKELFGRSTDSTSFKYGESAFKNELKKYGLIRLQSFHDACQACLDIMIEQGISSTSNSLYASLYLPYWNRLSWIEAEIKTRENEISVIETLRNSIEKKQLEIQNALELKLYLGDELWKELMSYRREDTYNNSNYISDGLSNADIYRNANDFIEVANKELYKSSTQQHSITASLKNLLFMKEFEPIVDSFETGNWIRIKTDGKLYRLRLIEYEIDFENPENIAVTFSDVTKIQGGYSDIESILNQASSMATSYDYVARQSKAGKSAREIVDGWVDRGLALTTQKIINDADNQSITMDSNGLLCKEYDSITDTFNDNQVKIINKGLYITNDNWKTAKAGIGAFTYTDPVSKKVVSSYGVIADTIVGKIILSENVGIYNSGNSVQIDKDGFVITFPSSNIPDNIFKIRKETTTGGYQNLLYVDEDGNLTLSGKIYATGGTIGGFNINKDNLTYGTSNSSGGFLLCPKGATYSVNSSGSKSFSMIVGNKFGVTTEGVLYAKDAVISGSIKASSIENGTYGEDSTGFSLTSSGALSASGATIRGNITATSLTLSGCEIPYSSVSGTPDLDIYIAEDGKIGTGTFANDGNSGKAFKVSSDGSLQAKNAVIYGTVYASGGEVGGFSIKNKYLKCGTVGSNNGFLLYPGGSSTTYSVAGSSDKSFSMIVGSDFGVTPSGKLHASSAEISGNITAKSLTLDGCSIKASAVKGENNKTLQDELYGSSTGTKLLFYKAGTAIKQAESDSAPTDASHANSYFSVSTQGLLTAANAVIYGTVYAGNGKFTGEVTASSGAIGVWNIGAGSVLYPTIKGIYTSGTISSTKYEIGLKSDFSNVKNLNFYVCKRNNSSWDTLFSISNEGRVVAQEASIGGWRTGYGVSEYYSTDFTICRETYKEDINNNYTIPYIEVGLKNQTGQDNVAAFYILKNTSKSTSPNYKPSASEWSIMASITQGGNFNTRSGYIQGLNGTIHMDAGGGTQVKLSKSDRAIVFCLSTSDTDSTARDVFSIYRVSGNTSCVICCKDLYSFTGVTGKAKKIVYVDEDGRFCVAS